MSKHYQPDAMLWINRTAYGVDFVNFCEEVKVVLPFPVHEIDFDRAPIPFDTPPFPPQIFYQIINPINND